MKLNKILQFIILLCFICNYLEARGVNGGMNCAACTIVTGVIQQEAYLRGISLFEAVKLYCKKLPMKIQEPCYYVVNSLEPFFTDKKVLEVFTPDVLCYALKSCHVDPGEKECHLFPTPPNIAFAKAVKQMQKSMLATNVHRNLQRLQQSYKNESTNVNSEMDPISNYLINLKLSMKYKKKLMTHHVDFCAMPLLREICHILEGTYSDLRPLQDFDGDGYSIIKSGRGTDWKGKDCDDLDPDIYPGSTPRYSDERVDSDCNGIYGTDPETNRPWEEILCSGTGSQGIAYLGDSVGAHFHFPEPWINPSIVNKNNIITKIDALLDELDWPELGFATGFKNTSHPDIIKGYTDSLYLRMRARNLCNHRDYQNIARNGAAANETVNEVHVMMRNPSDKPLIVIIGMVGNDVCNRFHNTVDNMTPPDQFRSHILNSLRALDEKLPLNSHVVLLSLVNASFIYPAMAERVHPLGSVLGNILYKDMYSWFSCMEIGPCEGWMSLNATLRQITSKKARELSDILKDIASNSDYKSFKVHYLENPSTKILAKWVADGHHIYEVIDRVDSTHPNQIMQPLMAKAIWEYLQDINILGPVNPNNDKITQLFGDQGGH